MTVESENDVGLRYFKTACLTAAFFVLGLCIAILGPVLPTLAYNLGTVEENLSFILTARGCGYLIGSLLCAVLFKKMNANLLIAICLLVTSIGSFAIPFMPHIILLALAVLTAGLSMGILDTGGNVLCLGLWGKKSDPWLQSLHFSFAFGAFVAPLIAKHFIREAHNSPDANSKLQSTVIPVHDITKSSNASESTLSATEVEHIPHVAWAFVINSLLALLVSIAFCFLSFSKSSKTESHQENTVKLEGKAYRLKILFLMFIFYFLYVGTEVTFGLFIYTFAIKCDLHYSKDTGALLNSLFWGTFAAGRFFAIFFSRCVSPKTMLVLDLIGTAVSTVAMSFFPYYDDKVEWLLWASIALYGWSMASLFPSGISWAEHYITVTERAATVFVVGAALGEMVLPFIMSHMIPKNPMYLMYFCATSTGLCILNFLILLKVSGTRGSRLNLTKKPNGEVESDRNDEKESYALVPTEEFDS